jgi:hypothetical protein
MSVTPVRRSVCVLWDMVIYDPEDVVLAILERNAQRQYHHWFHFDDLMGSVAHRSPFGQIRIHGRVISTSPTSGEVRTIMLGLLKDGLLERKGTGRAGDKYLWRISTRLKVQYSAQRIRKERANAANHYGTSGDHSDNDKDRSRV